MNAQRQLGWFVAVGVLVAAAPADAAPRPRGIPRRIVRQLEQPPAAPRRPATPAAGSKAAPAAPTPAATPTPAGTAPAATAPAPVRLPAGRSAIQPLEDRGRGIQQAGGKATGGVDVKQAGVWTIDEEPAADGTRSVLIRESAPPATATPQRLQPTP